MVYLDYNATTPMDKRVLDAMLPTFTETYGNPASTTHAAGMNAMDLVDDARESVGAVVGMNLNDAIFTSGATEANNMVFHGVGMDLASNRFVLYGATEHKSVIEACKHMGKFGLDARPIPVNHNGIIDIGELVSNLGETPVSIVSIMAANSETGVIQSIKEISQIVHDHGAMLHCDATQAIGRIPFNAYELGVDIVTFSSHKIYGPKGVGAVVATRDARKELGAMIYGGGQENNMRSGTLNVPGIVGFGMACQIIMQDGLSDMPRQEALRDDFECRMMEENSDIVINGGGAKRLPNTSNLRIKGALADAVIVNAPAIEISTGSACASDTIEPSHVLTAMGLSRDEADESIRVSIGKQTTQQDVDIAVDALSKAVKFVRGKEETIAEVLK